MTSKQQSEVLHQHFNAVKLIFSYIERKGGSWYSSLRVQKMGSELVGVWQSFVKAKGSQSKSLFQSTTVKLGLEWSCILKVVFDMI